MGFYQKVPEPIKRTWRYGKNTINSMRGFYWEKVIDKNPSKHAALEAKRQKVILLRPIDLENPKYFIEKMFWLKYNIYNKSSLVAQCYNKYEVRKYVESKGLGYILNELYGAWDSIEDIPWDELPEEYVMKISNGYAGHVFKRKGEPFSVKAASRTLHDTLRKYNNYYKITGDMFVGATRQKIICERLLHSNLGYTSPEDYKFYCFNGEPLFVEFMADRHGSSDYEYKEYFVDIDLNDRHDLELAAKPGTFERPVCYDEMVEIAKILSADFPFVRVDLYVEKGKPIFGELTFTPAHYQTEKSQIELGDLIDLTDAKIMSAV